MEAISKSRYIAARIAGLVIVLFLGIVLMLQVPAVQSGLARYVCSKLSDSLDGRLEIGSVQLHPFNAVTVRDAVIIDEHPYTEDPYHKGYSPADTLARIDKLSATLSLRTLFHKGGIHLRRVEIDGILFHLVSEPDTPHGSNIGRIFRIPDGGDSQMTMDTIFTINKLKVKDARYTMVNFGPGSVRPEHGINYEDMDVSFDLEGHDIGFWGGRCHAVADMLRASEKSGYDILRMSGRCSVGMGKTEIYDVKMSDACGSRMDLKQVNFIYDDTKAWSDFVNSVTMDIILNPSRVAMPSVTAYSTGAFYGCPLVADFSGGRFLGTVNDFTLYGINISDAHGASGRVDGRFTGVTDISSASTDASITGLNFTTAALGQILSDFGAGLDLSNYAPGTVFKLDASCSGPLNDLTANADISSSAGALNARAKARGLMQNAASINGTIQSRSLDLGKILNSSSLGLCSLVAEGGVSLGRKGTNAEITRLDISELGLLGYNYSGIELNGSLQDNKLAATLHSSDPNALLDLTGDFDIKRQSGQLNAVLENVDLAALNLDTRGGKSTISCAISGEQGLNSDNPLRFHFEDLVLANDGGTYKLGDVDAGARIDSDCLTLVLSSEFADAKYNGPIDVPSLVSYAKSISVGEFLPDFFPLSKDEAAPKAADATLSAVFHDTSGLLAFLLPGSSIAPGTTLNADVSADGTLLGYLTSPSLKYNGIGGKTIDLALDNQNGQLSCTVNAGKLTFNDMSFDKASLGVNACDNMAQLALNYEGADLLDKGSELYLDAFLSRDEGGKPMIDIAAKPSFIRVKDDVWELDESQIYLRDGVLNFDGFMIASDTQGISIDGGFSTSRADTLYVDFQKMDLAVLNSFLKDSGHEFKGMIDGALNLTTPVSSNLSLDADLTVSGLYVDDVSAGDLRLVSMLDESGEHMHVRLINTKGERNEMILSGVYGMKDKSADATLSLNNFNAGIAAPFLKEILPEISGALNGTVKAKGPVDKLELASDGVQLRDLRVKIGPTNVAYILNGTLGLDNEGLKFNSVGLKDEFGGLGAVNGKLGFRHFKDFRLDAILDMYRLKAINIPTSGSLGIYGDLAVSGNGHISGPFDNLYLDADVATAGNGSVNVPVTSSSTAQGSDLLVFTKAEDSAAAEESGSTAQAAPVKSTSKFTAHAKLTLYPDAIASVEIDKDSGHVLTAGGNGSLVLDLNTGKGELALKGDYNIDRGKYLFNIPGIVSKDFDIKQGSSIKFNGDVMESALDISVLHNVKTSLTPLVGESGTASSRRSVECGINIGGKLSSPEVSFSIDVPDLEPNAQTQVNAALSSEDKVQKQFVALLLLGTFLPEEGAGVVNGTNMIMSNVGEIVSSQLNNILQKLDIPLDFGLGYQQDYLGTDIFDVAVSTQLFNNRVLVNGSVGNRKYSTSTSANGDVVGDLDIEIKMDRSGDLRFKVFSHSADEFTSSLDFSQRNGIGFSYQREFDRLVSFVKSIFTKRSVRNQEALEAANRKKEMTTIIIDE